MTTIDMNKCDGSEPEPTTVLGKLNADRPVRPAIDTNEPVLPEWVRDRAALVATAKLSGARGWYRTKRIAVAVPVIGGLLLRWSPRGLGRLIAALSKYLYDYDSAAVRHQHAGNVDTPEYARAQAIRKANLRARWMVASAVLVVVAVPVLAWTYPAALAAILAAVGFVWTVKIIPGREAWELLIAAGVAVGLWFVTPVLAARIPAPPVWAVAVVLVGAVLALGYLGRPAGRKLAAGTDLLASGLPEKPSAAMVIDALVAAVPGVSDKNRDSVRLHAPGIARGRHGYYMRMELVPGITVSDVMENRESFAGALRRPLGAVWPGHAGMHPGDMRLFLGDEPMATAEQPPWPLTLDRRIDIFDPLKLFTDQECAWVEQRLMYNAIVVGGAPGFGKTFFLRAAGVAIARDPRTRLVILDGKANGDMRPFRAVAHGYHEGDEPEEIAAQLAAVQAIRQEMRRRARFLRELPAEENPEDKVTTHLVDRYPHLAPIFLLIDECQVYTEHPDKKIREAFIEALADIVRRGRSAGIVPVFCTQKPSADVLPTAIVDNCSVRVCFKVNGQRANDAVLGNEMHKTGIKSTKFGPDDKGLAWLKGDGAQPLVVRSPHGIDKPAAEALLKQCRAMRERLGLLTGEAAGEAEESPEPSADLLDDVYEVVRENGCRNTSLEHLQDKLALLRPGIYGHMDTTALGGALRGAGVKPDAVHCPVEGRTMRGVKVDWITDAIDLRDGPEDDPDLTEAG